MTNVSASLVRKAVFNVVPEYKVKNDNGRVNVSGHKGDDEILVTVDLQLGLLNKDIEDAFNKVGTLLDNDKKIANKVAVLSGLKVKKVNTYNTRYGESTYIYLV